MSKIHNLDSGISESFQFTVKGHDYNFKQLNTEESSEFKDLQKNVDKAKELQSEIKKLRDLEYTDHKIEDLESKIESKMNDLKKLDGSEKKSKEFIY